MMGPFKISWKSLRAKSLSTALSIVLVAFGIGILTILLLASSQINEKLTNNSKDIDLVVGAKGSPLQLVLSSIYYIDFPTGNIPYKDALEVMSNPLVKRAVPLALGDNYNGVRIVGTDSNFVGLYGLELTEGKFWKKDYETTIGAVVAKNMNLKVGDSFFGAHGLTGTTDVHKSHEYKVAGILKPQGNVTDNLILTNIASVWKMHEEEEDDHHQEIHDEEESTTDLQGKELTSLLIQYRSPMSVVLFPRMINESTNMQAASPAMESARLFSLIGVGMDTLQWFSVLIMLIAVMSVFVNLYNSLKERSYDLAIMRTLGASKTKIFIIIIMESVIITSMGSLIGLVLGHLTVQLIGSYQDSNQARLTGLLFMTEEFYLLLIGVLIGIFAAILPAITAYKTNISKILASD
jgi:putative ABC transport system permease protein